MNAYKENELAHLSHQIATTKRLALTTIERKDYFYADRLQTATVRGDNELLNWGVGPSLSRGDIVALYTPKSKFLPPSEWSVIRRLYSVATATLEDSRWKHRVLLYHRVTLDPPLSFEELNEYIGITAREIQGASKRKMPWNENKAEKFWNHIFNTRPHLIEPIKRRLLKGTDPDDVGISYSSEDWTVAHRLMHWCEASKLNAFFVTSVGDIRRDEREPLENLLREVFTQVKIALFIVPKQSPPSEWVKFELQAAIESIRNIVQVRIDKSRDWLYEPQESRNLIDLNLAGEFEVIRRLKQLIPR